MKQTKYLLFLLLPLIFFAGCIRGQAVVSLNPNGSGKIMFEGLYDPCSLKEEPDVSQSFRGFIEDIKNTLLKSEGIDAWKNVDWRVVGNDKFYFRAQAYFKSIDDVTICLGNMKGNLKAFYQRNEKQLCLLELKSLKTEANDITTDIQRRHSAVRYELFCQAVEKILDGLRVSIILYLPADVEKFKGFNEIDQRAVQYVLDGKQMLYLLESIRQQRQYELVERQQYNRVEFLNNELLPLWLDNWEPLKVYFSDSNEYLFDYEKEKTNAQKEYLRIMERLESTERESQTESGPNENTDKPLKALPKYKVGYDDISVRLRRGLALEAKSEYASASEIYSKIIADGQAGPKYLAHAHYRKGMCLFEIGDSNDAIEQFEYVLANFPSQRIAALRSLKMVQDIRSGSAKRRADKPAEIPTITGSEPEMFTEDVDFEFDKITITFSEPMDTSSWFYSSFSPGALPQATGAPSFDSSGKQWTLPVALEPGKVYAIAFNGGDAVKDAKNLKPALRSASGKMCRPFVLVFSVITEDNIPTEIDEELITKSEEINSKQ
ncbi:MAG: Ig-like domain-containing protein [Phycisphaerae bacterium]|jgi:tetratricopeptide (TPR) repeat protein